MKPVIIRSHQSPVRSENAMIRSMIPTNRNMNAVIWAIAMNVSFGMDEREDPAEDEQDCRGSRSAPSTTRC